MDVVISSILAPTISIISYYQAYPDWKNATCDHFARNAYLYTLSMLVIFWMFITILNYTGIGNNIINTIFSSWLTEILYLIIIIVSLMLVQWTNPQKVALKHFLLLVFIFLFSINGVVLYIAYQNVLIAALAISILIGFITYQIVMTYPTLVTPKRAELISYGIIFLFIINLIFIISVPHLIAQYPSIIYTSIFVFSILFAVLFSLRMMVHHQNIVDHAKICDLKTHIPDYINEAVGVFITFVNLLIEIASILSGRRRKY